MSWPLASFVLLGLALGAGLLSYERTRPSARVLALVATMAAFAALGRVAFAAVPNVKPTTDIVLITGGALGGPAGFAVGAVAALASNVVFGQGPWTPWQMLAWALCGVLGALLARAGGERVLRRRVPLALACGAAGLMFGAIVDLGSVSTAGGIDLGRRFVATDLGSSLPWNVAHAVGNVAFALLFGPALYRSLARFRRRSTVTFRPAGASALPLLALAVLALAPVALARTSRSYLERAQHADGGFGAAPRSPSSPLYSSWAALGLAADGVNPADARHGGRSALAYLERGARGLRAAGDLERTALVAGAAGVDPRAFGGRDLVAAIERSHRGSGAYGGQVNTTAFAIFALRIAGVPAADARIRGAAAYLAREQDRDGGWNFFRGGAPSDADDTGAVLQALAAAGRAHGRAAARGYGWLARHQSPDGGFAQMSGGPSNAQSTAWAVQGIFALGRDPSRLHRRGARSPVAYLRSLREPGGAVRYSRLSSQTPVWVTAEAELALRGRVFPLAAVPRRRVAARRAVAPAAPATRARPAAPQPRRSASVPGRRRAPRRAASAGAGRIAPHGAPAPLVRSAGVVSALILLPFR